MKKVITYGTYDLLHEGHINLLQRAKALGDYLIVGVTNDNFDRERGKLNVRNNVLERVEAVKALNIADQIIIEEYVGQKIDDIQKYGVDIFTVGSDWVGHFDYLKEFCEVIYLPRTKGISSTMLREESQGIVKLGVVGLGRIAKRFIAETSHVSGIRVQAIYDINKKNVEQYCKENHCEAQACDSFNEILQLADAVYIATPHLSHYDYCKQAILSQKHVICETPLVLNGAQAEELYKLATEKKVVLLEANKTAHCPAFNHLMVMIKSGVIGEVVDVEASLSKLLADKTLREFDASQAGGSMYELGSYPLLPIIKLMGTNYESSTTYSKIENGVDIYTKGMVHYQHAVCSYKLGLGIKTEGNLIISGTKGYAYVPAPWWLTDYFELRYEDQNLNKKFFYKWDGEGLRYEIQEFVSCIFNQRYSSARLSQKESIAIAKLMEQFTNRVNHIDL